MKGLFISKIKGERVVLMALLFLCCLNGYAQSRQGRIGLGVGCLYERGMDISLSYDYETKYHNAWEVFAMGYGKWKVCESCGHVCNDSMWNNYGSYNGGVAYKPCITRGRNSYGNLRVGVIVGSDNDNFLYGGTVGYEQNYCLKAGWVFYWRVKSDILCEAKDLFRTGVVLGIKMPIK